MTSSIKAVIESATSSTLTSEKWDDYFSICDYINQSPDHAKEVAKALRKRLNTSLDQSAVSLWYCLLLIETCVKNTSYSFHIHISNRDFLSEMIRVIAPKHKPSQEVYQKVISMIQDWYEMFQSNSQLSDVARVRAELIAKGHEFPIGKVQENIYDDFEGAVKDNPSFEDPIAPPAPHAYRSGSVTTTNMHPPPRLSTRSDSLTHPTNHLLYGGQDQQRRVSSGGVPANTTLYPNVVMPYTAGPHVAQSQFQAAYYNGVNLSDQPGSCGSVPIVPTEVQVCKLNCELELVSSNIHIMCDVITELENKSISSDEKQFMEELNGACREMQRRIVELLTRVEHESLIQHLLLINDDLNNAFLRYDRFIRHQGIASGRIPSAKGRPPTSLAPLHSQPEESDHIYSECGPKNDVSSHNNPPYPISVDRKRPPLPPIPVDITEQSGGGAGGGADSNEGLLINFEESEEPSGDVLPSYDTAMRGGMASRAVTGVGAPEEVYEDFDNLARSRLQSTDKSHQDSEPIDKWLTRQEEEYVLPSQVPSQIAKNDFDLFLSDQLKKMKTSENGDPSESHS